MAFFDEIGRKLTQTGQSAIRKATEMADVAKLNAAISEEEKKVTNAYYQIGQTYVDTHKNNIGAEFEVLVAQINDSVDKISELKRQIQDLKGVKRCTYCGAEIPLDATFCSSCGNAVPHEKAVNAVDTLKCPNCEKIIEKGTKFCTFCGHELSIKSEMSTSVSNINSIAPFEDTVNETSDIQSASEKAVVTQKPIIETVIKTEETFVEKPNLNICPNCGFEGKEGAQFCVQCGTKIS